MKKIIVFFALPLLLFSMLCLSGCAAGSHKKIATPAESEKELRAAVTQFHEAKIAGDWERVHAFFYEPYKRSTTKLQFMATPRKLKIKAFSIETISFDAAFLKAEVMVKLDVEMKGFLFKETPQKQNWIIENDRWVNVVSPEKDTSIPMKQN